MIKTKGLKNNIKFVGYLKGDKKWEKAVSDFIRAKKSSGELEALFDKYMTTKFITE